MMRRLFFKKFRLFSRRGFTLVELVLAMAVLSILVVALSSAMSFGTDFYLKNRKVSQATSLANDIVKGINAELYNAYGGYIENEVHTGQGASLAFSSDAKYSAYGRRIFLDTSTYTVVCQNRDGTQTDSLKSRYQKDLYVKNLYFEVRHNPAYDNDGVTSSGMFDGSVDNILAFSFQIYDAENMRLLYEVKNFSVVLDNMVNQINKSSVVNNEKLTAEQLRAMLVIGHGEIPDQIIDGINVAGVVNDENYFGKYAEYKENHLDFDTESLLNTDKNLKALYYNMLYIDLESE